MKCSLPWREALKYLVVILAETVINSKNSGKKGQVVQKQERFQVLLFHVQLNFFPVF